MIHSVVILRYQSLKKIMTILSKYRDRREHPNNLAANLMKEVYSEKIQEEEIDSTESSKLIFHKIKYFWIAYSQICEYVYILYKDMTFIYLSWHNYLDKCIAECSMNNNSCNKYWILKKKNFRYLFKTIFTRGDISDADEPPCRDTKCIVSRWSPCRCSWHSRYLCAALLARSKVEQNREKQVIEEVSANYTIIMINLLHPRMKRRLKLRSF